jgi:sugar/nucleoside kinase (ribokinase family)
MISKDVIGIGLSNIDLVAHVEDSFLEKHKVAKGQALRFDDLSFARLRADLKQYEAVPGGCAANTVCGLAASGVPTAFYGKIGSDGFESLYRSSFRDFMVEYEVEASSKESSQCATLVTPDGERSFAYIDGASWDLDSNDIDENVISSARIICTEIYMLEFGASKTLPGKIASIAKEHKIPLVMKIMDQDFARRHADWIKRMAQEGVLTLLIGNHLNLPALAGTGNIDDTIDALRAIGCETVMTANKDGSYHISKENVLHHPAYVLTNPSNTTGAGDQFLAGFLMGMLEHRPVMDCLSYASTCARQILMLDSARPALSGRSGIRF